MLARINVYRDKALKWRWNVMLSTVEGEWNTVCQCTDTHDTEDGALDEATEVICNAWVLDIPDVPTLSLWQRFTRWIKV